MGGILADVLCSVTRGRHRQFWQDYSFFLNSVLFAGVRGPPWSAVVRAPPVLGHGGRRVPRRAVARARHSGFTSHAEETGENASEAVCLKGTANQEFPLSYHDNNLRISQPLDSRSLCSAPPQVET